MRWLKNLLFAGIYVTLIPACNQLASIKTTETKEDFSFVFMTDIHLQPEKNAIQGFQKAIDEVNTLNPDFVITGGDNIMDALAQNRERSDSLYRLFDSMIESFDMPVYTTMGNHELFGVYEQSGISSEHPEYGKKMYEKRLADRYYTFEHKGWQFIILDGVEITDERRYRGFVDSLQMEWLKQQLQQIGKEKPVIISIHIPLLSVESHFALGPTQAFKNNSIVNNANEVIDILNDYNVKLVLQGHTHFLEDIFYNGIHYITGGAVSGAVWNGKRFEMEEGFLVVSIKNNQQFSWEYIDYGWEANQ
jgi:3',5'-cyclic AMP phosphodiesterase CpdA